MEDKYLFALSVEKREHKVHKIFLLQFFLFGLKYYFSINSSLECMGILTWEKKKSYMLQNKERKSERKLGIYHYHKGSRRIRSKGEDSFDIL